MDRLDIDLELNRSQDSLKTVPRGLLRSSWGALGPSLEGLGGLLGRLEGVLGCSWELLGTLGTVLAALRYLLFNIVYIYCFLH